MEDAISYLERQHTAPGQNKEGEGMLKIGEQTINEIGTAVTAVLLDHMPELDKVYQTCEKALTVGVSIKIEPCAEGNRCDIGLSFVTSKVKAHAIRLVNEMYEPMFKEQG